MYGLATDIIEPTRKVKVFAPNGNTMMDEVITLGLDDAGHLAWRWSWDMPICHADDIDDAVAKIKNVVSASLA